MHYYKFNIGDYSSHTSRLSLLEDLAYRRLIDLYYLNEKPFAGSVREIAREIGMLDQTGDVEYVLNKFFTLQDGSFYHKRIEKELSEYKNKKDLAKKAGKASGEARRRKSNKTKETNGRSADVQQTFNGCSTDVHNKSNGRSTDVQQTFNGNDENVQPTINHKPITNNQIDKDTNVSCEASFTLVAQSESKRLMSEQIKSIFDYWVFVMNKNPKLTMLSDSRAKKIGARIKQGYSVDIIKRAIDNCSRTPHNMGLNDNNKLYNDIELICRNSEKLESFLTEPVQRVSLQQRTASMDWGHEI